MVTADISREQMIQAIRPCPFCGGDAEIDAQRAYRNLRTGSVETAVAVYCVSCAAEQAICHADVPGVTREMVIELWNARITHTALTEATARVRVLEISLGTMKAQRDRAHSEALDVAAGIADRYGEGFVARDIRALIKMPSDAAGAGS